MSVDLTTNLICVWLMFAFSDKYWQFIVKRICCCCYCCVFKEEFLIQMASISKAFSIRRDTHRQTNAKSPIHSTVTPNHSNSNNNNNNNSQYNPPKQDNDIVNFSKAKDIKSIKKDNNNNNNNNNNSNNNDIVKTNKMDDDDDDIEIIQS
eukprot:89828_1